MSDDKSTHKGHSNESVKARADDGVDAAVAKEAAAAAKQAAAVAKEAAALAAKPVKDDLDKAPPSTGGPIDPGERRIGIGVDVGGSGIKVAAVDLDSGQLISPRHRVPTPQPSAPAAVIASIARLVKKISTEVILAPHVAVGVGFPAVVIDGVTKSAANVDPGWVDFDADAAMERVLRRPVHIVNDADAAGVAEMRFGAGVGQRGTVFLITLGTGTGSALFYNGMLVPNLELGHMEIRGRDAERRSAGVRPDPSRPLLEGLGGRSRRAPARDRAAVLAPDVHHRRRGVQAIGAVHPPADRPCRGRPRQAAQRRGDRGCRDGVRRAGDRDRRRRGRRLRHGKQASGAAYPWRGAEPQGQ